MRIVITSQDLKNGDLLLVFGTSLKVCSLFIYLDASRQQSALFSRSFHHRPPLLLQVAPVGNLPGDVSPYCPRVLCNREPTLVLTTGACAVSRISIVFYHFI